MTTTNFTSRSSINSNSSENITLSPSRPNQKNQVHTYSHNHFNDLPIEILQHIAAQIEGDNDLGKYRFVCKATKESVDADNLSFWRRRFHERFEKSAVITNNAEFKRVYQRRRFWLKNGAIFKTGDTRKEKECLEVLRELVVDAFSEKKPTDKNETTYESVNMEQIRRFMFATNLLQILFEPIPLKRSSSRFDGRRQNTTHPTPTQPTALMQTLQVLCAPMLLSLEPYLIQCHFGFPDSQAAVYASAEKKPFFGGHYGLDVQMEFMLQNLNFWKYHMVREHENTLFYAFEELEEADRPRWWSEQLAQGTKKLGRHWKGSYAYIERQEIDAIRRAPGEDGQIQDYFAGEDNAFSFQDMALRILPEEEQVHWPRAFEKILHSLAPPPSTAKTRAQKRSASPADVAAFKPLSFQFEGQGQDVQEDFLAAGWLNPLPPQQGIPGWQRMTMMKYFELETGEVDVDALWAYEGVVLPGGQVVVGRWWSPGDGVGEEMYSGPFILWCVDGPQHGDEEWEGDEGVMVE